MSTVVAELNEIIKLLEADIPASQSSPKNQKLKQRLEKSMAKYFDSLANAFPYQKLSAIYNRYVGKE